MGRQTLMRVVCAGVFLAAAGAYAADSITIPADWNQTTWTSGCYFESFNDAVPAWAGDSTITADTTTEVGTRFWRNDSTASYALGKQLCFSTTGITNTFTGANSTELDPLYVDMMCKFTLMDGDPANETGDFLLRTYVNSGSNLVVQTVGKTNTLSAVADRISPDAYYRLTIKLMGTNYQVKVNDVAKMTLSGTMNGFTKLILTGSGYIDDLYVSHGDPSRSAGYVAGASAFSNAGTTGASDAELHAVNNWLATTNTAIAAGTTGVTIDKVSKYFLTSTEPKVTSGVLDDASISLGISDFSYDPSTSKITVKVYLKVNDAAKTGKINGRIQLYGKADRATTTWTALDAKTPMMTDFTDGYTASYTFDAASCTFFKPVIVTE